MRLKQLHKQAIVQLEATVKHNISKFSEQMVTDVFRPGPVRECLIMVEMMMIADPENGEQTAIDILKGLLRLRAKEATVA